MAKYKFLQMVGGNEAWSVFLASQEGSIVKTRKPAFTTILAADNDFSDPEMGAEDFAKVHYYGDFYADFDASSLDEVIPKFQQFLKQLQDSKGFNLEQASLFASGKKGFHVLIPTACFMEKTPVHGVVGLPAIYKEMVFGLYVDTIDLRVYSSRKGRMFRTPNVERPDKPGVYKVPLTTTEAMGITVEKYREYCSAPRYIAPPAPPEYNSDLGLAYTQAHDKIVRAAKNKKKSQVDESLLKKFDGGLPPTVLAIMKGEPVTNGAGFQKISLQLAITVHALGKTEDQFIEMCEGLCESHQSDGSRYNSAQKRRSELKRMFRYTEGNPCYSFGIGGIKSLLDKGYKSTDLDVSSAILDENGDVLLPASITQGLTVGVDGIHRKVDESLSRISEVGLANPKQLIDSESGDTIGYEVDVFVKSQPKGQKILTMDTFLGRNKFLQFTLSSAGSSINATDAQVGAIADILRVTSERSGTMVYTTSREGLDIVNLPTGETDVIWADNQGVISKLGISYRLVGRMVSTGEYKTDLRMAPPLRHPDDPQVSATDPAGEFFTKLMQINRPDALGRMLGWYLACFYNQPLRLLYNQFPSLQVFGAAGSGKSKTNELLAHLHYYKNFPKTQSAPDATAFVLDTLASSSASIPLILDEFKPRDLSRIKLDKLRTLIRGNYTSLDLSRGWRSADTGQAKFDLRSVRNSAPLVIIGEALESQKAIIDRSVVVALDKAGKAGKAGDFLFCMQNRQYLSRLGRMCLDRVQAHLDLEGLGKVMQKHISLVEDTLRETNDDDRPIFNIATVLTGLEFGRRVLAEVFGTTFNESFKKLSDSILFVPEDIMIKAMSEASAVLDVMSFLSHQKQDSERCALVFGTDYVVNPVRKVIEVHLRNCYTKYVRFKRTLGEEVLYDKYEAFVNAMNHYSGVSDKVCIDSALKTAISMQVYAFKISYFDKEGVGVFRNV